LKHAATLTNPIFHPFIEGKEYSVDLYISKNGKAKGGVVRSRDVVVNGESQITTTVENKKILEVSTKLAEALKLYGHVVLQVLQNNENIYIIECNSRFGGASTLSLAAGLDSFYWFLLESNKINIDGYPFVPSKKVKKQIRFPEDIIL
jgi:carbamoyl-phosphate synthase large subunit